MYWEPLKDPAALSEQREARSRESSSTHRLVATPRPETNPWFRLFFCREFVRVAQKLESERLAVETARLAEEAEAIAPQLGKRRADLEYAHAASDADVEVIARSHQASNSCSQGVAVHLHSMPTRCTQVAGVSGRVGFPARGVRARLAEALFFWGERYQLAVSNAGCAGTHHCCA